MSRASQIGELNADIAVQVLNHLTKVTSCQPLPKAYDDSTHSIWRLNSPQGRFALKECQPDLLTNANAIFWQATQHWFGLNLPKMLGDYDQVYQFLTDHSGLEVPDLIACQSATAQTPGWLLNRWHEGLSIQQPTPILIIDLANHLGKLHQHQQPYFGTLTGQVMPMNDWALRMQSTLTFLQNASASALNPSTIKTLQNWQPKICVPVMLDLRFDQFLQDQTGHLQALIDCDAFVWAPSELALVQLQVLLSEDDFELFRKHYLTWVVWPKNLNATLQSALLALLKQMTVFGAAMSNQR